MKKSLALLLLAPLFIALPATAQEAAELDVVVDAEPEMITMPFPSAEEVLAMSGPGGDALFIAAPGTMGPAPRMMAMHQGMHRSGGNPFADLNLTDDQYEKLFALRRDSIGKIAPKMGEIAVLEMQMKDLMLQPEMDSTKIQAVQNRINSAKADMANARLQQKMSMMAVLTPEQRKDLRLKMIKGGPGRCSAGFGRGKECPVLPK